MEMFSGAVITELVNRAISFLFTWGKKRPTATVEEDLQLLRRLLMRSDKIIEETERRDVVNLDMLKQLSALRDKAYTGYYILDTMRCQQALLAAAGGSSHGGGGGGEEEEEEEEKLRRSAFALSRFNPAKRVRFPFAGAPPEPSTSAAAAAASSRELSQMVCSLEAMINGMDEFVVLLLSCPPLYHQPYSAHLYLDRCMFGRAMEKEAVIDFLLQSAGPPAGGNLGVLPIIGPTHIGKSTLVEHVCQDEKVRSHFFLISIYTGSSSDDLSDETEASFRAKCEIKHRNHAASEKRWLVVVELVADVDEEAWARLYSGEARTAPRGSKMIVTSRSEKIARFGTAPALRLRRLPVEAYWYLFRTSAFGSDDPGQHPEMSAIALEMVDVMRGSFMFASMAALLFRMNFNTQSWARILARLRQYLRKNASLIGEFPDDVKSKAYPRFTWSALKEKPDKYFMLHDIYQRRGSAHEQVPQISYLDLLAGRAQPLGKYEILFWESRIPPYFNYICTCETRDM